MSIRGLKKKQPKTFKVKIITVDAEMEFSCEVRVPMRNSFNLIFSWEELFVPTETKTILLIMALQIVGQQKAPL